MEACLLILTGFAIQGYVSEKLPEILALCFQIDTATKAPI